MNTLENFLYRSGQSSQTIKIYSFHIVNFLNSNPNANNYRYKDVLNYMTQKIKDYKNSDTKNVILSAIKKYYDYLIDSGLRNDHPCKSLILQKRRSKDIIHQDLFTSTELELMLEREERFEILKLKNQTLISLLIYQGLTSSEIVNLKVSNIDLDNGTIFIKGSRNITTRHLDLVPKQYKIIDRYIHKIRNELLTTTTDQLLIGKLGLPITIQDVRYIIKTFKPLFPDRILNSHTIRMSVISNWLNEKRIPLEQVQLMTGHKWISATAKYRYNPIDEQRELINRFHPLG